MKDFKFSKQKFKIIFVLLISFFCVKTISPKVFLGDTPRVNPFFVEDLKNAPYYLAQTIKNTITAPVRFFANLGGIFSNRVSQPINNVNYQNQSQFSSNSNQINPDIFANIQSNITPPPHVRFIPVKSNVYAGEDPQTGDRYLKIEAGAKYRIVGTITINGKTYPKIEFVE